MICVRCETDKLQTEFRRLKKPNGQTYYRKKCKRCEQDLANARIAKNPEQREKRRQTAKNWRERFPERYRASHWKKNGIDPVQAEAYYQSHHGKCDLCGNVDSKGINLSVDHCHETGRIRGMLCGNCNRGIGLLKDDFHLLKKAAYYVMRHRNLSKEFDTWEDIPYHYATWEDFLKGNLKSVSGSADGGATYME